MPGASHRLTLADVDLPALPPLLTRVPPAWWRDLDRAAATGYGVVAALLLAKHADGVFPILGAAGCALATAWPIAARVRHPAIAFLVSFAALGVIAAWQPRSAVAALVPLGLVLYTAASRFRPGLAGAALGAALASAVATALPDFKHSGGATFFSVLYAAAWMIGFAVGTHRRYTALALRGQAQQARIRLDRARHDLVEQRMSIARELHDVVTHHMSVVTVQAGYGGLLLESVADTSEAARARAALEVIETAGREALEEMRRLVEVLRAEDTEPEHPSGTGLVPAPGLADLQQLIVQAAHAGVPVTVSTAGSPCPLPPGEDLAAYRIVQEALTNVIKHAGTPTTLRLAYSDENVTIEITNTSPPAERSRHEAAAPHTGRGTAGMRERALLYGGELSAGPTGDGGFRVAARLPLRSVLVGRFSERAEAQR